MNQTPNHETLYGQNSKMHLSTKSIPIAISSSKNFLPTCKFKVIFYPPLPSFGSRVQAIGDWPWSPKHRLAIAKEW